MSKIILLNSDFFMGNLKYDTQISLYQYFLSFHTNEIVLNSNNLKTTGIGYSLLD